VDGRFTTETFFRPQEEARQESAIPAGLYNTCQRLLRRIGADCLFVPIRSMQYQAVIDREEIIFVDSQGGYAYQDGQGGRLIRIAWEPRPPEKRESLIESIPCDIVFYFPDLKETQLRLVGEFTRTLERIEQREREQQIADQGPRILPFRGGEPD
jgi:hypothetical protein